jgi:hypothetical protein
VIHLQQYSIQACYAARLTTSNMRHKSAHIFSPTSRDSDGVLKVAISVLFWQTHRHCITGSSDCRIRCAASYIMHVCMDAASGHPIHQWYLFGSTGARPRAALCVRQRQARNAVRRHGTLRALTGEAAEAERIDLLEINDPSIVEQCAYPPSWKECMLLDMKRCDCV